MPTPLRMLAWLDPGQEPLAREVVAGGELAIVRAGSTSHETAADVARAFGAERFVDLRRALAASDGIDLIWLAGAEEVDAESLRIIDESGLPAFTSHPQPASLSDLLASSNETTAAVRFVPLMRRSPGFRASTDVLPDFGEIAAVNVSFRAGPSCRGLSARLYDAMDVVTELCGDVDVLDAALASRDSIIPETLGELRGHMTINMRFSDNRCACIAVSDAAGTWFRGVTLLGEGGCIRISDGDFEWVDPGGNRIDSHEVDEPLSPGELTAMQIARAMERPNPDEAPQTAEMNARLLAVCEAARLSCRTGYGESPRKLLEMRSRP